MSRHFSYSLGADPMESVASDWSSTTDSDSSLDKDDVDVEEQETQSTIEPLSPEFRGRKRDDEDGEECATAEDKEEDDEAVVRRLG